jgi:hypothetical protein
MLITVLTPTDAFWFWKLHRRGLSDCTTGAPRDRSYLLYILLAAAVMQSVDGDAPPASQWLMKKQHRAICSTHATMPGTALEPDDQCCPHMSTAVDSYSSVCRPAPFT